MVIDVYVAVVHICLQLILIYFVIVLHQSNCQEILLRIFLWPKAVYKARVLSD